MADRHLHVFWASWTLQSNLFYAKFSGKNLRNHRRIAVTRRKRPPVGCALNNIVENHTGVSMPSSFSLGIRVLSSDSLLSVLGVIKYLTV